MFFCINHEDYEGYEKMFSRIDRKRGDLFSNFLSVSNEIPVLRFLYSIPILRVRGPLGPLLPFGPRTLADVGAFLVIASYYFFLFLSDFWYLSEKDGPGDVFS